MRAHADGDAVEMAFDDVILPMPQAPDTVSPLLALPTVLQAARTGHLDLVWAEDGALVCRLVPDDRTTVRLTLDENDLPAAAEVAVDGHTCVTCAIKAWSAEKRDGNEPNDTDVGGDPP